MKKKLLAVGLLSFLCRNTQACQEEKSAIESRSVCLQEGKLKITNTSLCIGAQAVMQRRFERDLATLLIASSIPKKVVASMNKYAAEEEKKHAKEEKQRNGKLRHMLLHSTEGSITSSHRKRKTEREKHLTRLLLRERKEGSLSGESSRSRVDDALIDGKVKASSFNDTDVDKSVISESAEQVQARNATEVLVTEGSDTL
ncbi:hypothetical protein KBC04_00225 [Candidatus Babeliales bacterium]|nr:hypothetical protein [Candidatus Babeliales bacterium]MBP9843483.1 hypothetical protein [Candidatus Babeliales bacterium]